jgi:hypothetical protein
MRLIISALKLVFRDPLYLILSSSLALSLLLIYYLIFLSITTLSLLFSTTNAFYSWSSIILTIFTSLFFGISLSLLIYRWRQISAQRAIGGKDFIGGFFGALSMGCPVCGSFLLPFLGIAGGLSVFPFQGLELKLVALFLFGFSIYQSSKKISGKTCLVTEKLVRIENGNFIFNLNKTTLTSLFSFLLPLLILAIVILLPALPAKYKFNLAQKGQAALTSPREISAPLEEFSIDTQAFLEQINPSSGYEINASYGDIGPKLLEGGAIDFEKMKSLYEKAGAALTDEQITILTKGTNQKIKITPENSYFLLNFFWAFGLANKNPILDEGPMMKYGADQIGNFASTGGWTLGAKEATELYSKFEIIKLNSEQQKILEEFAFNSYRPCCSNPTGFPDCNHGMAALGLGEIMAAQGASAEEIFEAFKYVNAFWFPQTYFDIAKYFQAKEGKDWSQVDGRVIASQDYSTPQGWQRARQWLVANNLLEEAPAGGPGC